MVRSGVTLSTSAVRVRSTTFSAATFEDGNPYADVTKQPYFDE
jgi:hypothetical protein